MARPLNPDLIGLSDKEKRRYYARLYQNKTRDAYRQYQRAYQLKMTHNPNHKEEVKQRRIQELQDLMEKATEAYQGLTAMYQAELKLLQEPQNA